MPAPILVGNSWFRVWGEAVFSKFVDWHDYINFKRMWRSEKGEDTKDPGRTLFIWTQCKCLTAHETDPCACKIHTQQDLYMKALRVVDMDGREACDCRRYSAVGGGKMWKELWTHLGTFSDAIACPKVAYERGARTTSMGSWGGSQRAVRLTASAVGSRSKDAPRPARRWTHRINW